MISDEIMLCDDLLTTQLLLGLRCVSLFWNSLPLIQLLLNDDDADVGDDDDDDDDDRGMC